MKSGDPPTFLVIRNLRPKIKCLVKISNLNETEATWPWMGKAHNQNVLYSKQSLYLKQHNYKRVYSK